MYRLSGSVQSVGLGVMGAVVPQPWADTFVTSRMTDFVNVYFVVMTFRLYLCHARPCS